MRDQELVSYLQEWLEQNPSEGTWKMTATELKGLAETLSEICLECYAEGFNNGYDAAFTEGVEV